MAFASTFQGIIGAEEMVATILYNIRIEGKLPNGNNIRYTPNKADMEKYRMISVRDKAVNWLIKNENIIAIATTSIIVDFDTSIERMASADKCNQRFWALLQKLKHEFVQELPYLKYMDYRDINKFWEYVVTICTNNMKIRKEKRISYSTNL
jgi:hypothetical protein